MARTARSAFVAVLLLSVGCEAPVQPVASAGLPKAAAPVALPPSFEPNVGQADPAVRFLARGAGSALFLTDRALVMAVAGATGADSVSLTFEGANRVVPRAGDPLPGEVNVIRGRDRSGWRTGIPTYGRVVYEELYAGIDLVIHRRAGVPEYDFVIAPGARVDDIALAVGGTTPKVLRDGTLRLTTAAGTVDQPPPVIYQDTAAGRRTVRGGYTLQGNRVGFWLGAYDASLPVVIDPLVLMYSTFVGGGSFEDGGTIAVDARGDVYVSGATRSLDFPTTPGAFDATGDDDDDAFVTKIDRATGAIAYSTYLGGTYVDRAAAVAVDPDGSAVVTGVTYSDDFPTIAAADPTAGDIDAFVTRFGVTGVPLFSTYLGGSLPDDGLGVAVGVGGIHVVGSTESADFPSNPALDPSLGGSLDGYVATYSPAGAFLNARFLGGGDDDGTTAVALSGGGHAVVVGFTRSGDFPTTPGAFDPSLSSPESEGFVTRLSPGLSVTSSTYLGGSGEEVADGIAVDASGAAYVAGHTNSMDFPTLPGAYSSTRGGTLDAFVTKLDAGGAGVYSTLFGGGDIDSARGIAVDDLGRAFIAGETHSADLPMMRPLDSTITPVTATGGADAFVALFTSGGNALVASSFLGGDAGQQFAQDVAMAPNRDLWVVGETFASDFPTTMNAADRTLGGPGDIFVTRLRISLIRELLESIWAELRLYRFHITTLNDARRLDDSLEHLEASFEPSLWSDGDHPASKVGKMVFHELSLAVGPLDRIQHDKDSSVDPEQIQTFIDAMVGAARSTAQQAIDETKGDFKEMVKAMEEMGSGDEAATDGKPAQAIHHFGQAWQLSEKAAR